MHSASGWSDSPTHLELVVPLSLKDLQAYCTLFLGSLDLGNHELDAVPKLHLLLFWVKIEGDHPQLASLARVVDDATAFRPATGRGGRRGGQE